VDLSTIGGPAPTLIFSVMSYAFYEREFNSKAAYRMGGSHVTLIVPAPVSANPISSFQVTSSAFLHNPAEAEKARTAAKCLEIFLDRRWLIWYK